MRSASIAGANGGSSSAPFAGLEWSTMTEKQPISIPFDYAEVESAPVSWSNYFLIQYDHGEWVLTVAQVPPPIVIDEEQLEKIGTLSSITVKPITRVVVSRAKLSALAELIQRQLERFPDSIVGPETEGEGN